jgi:glucose/mannose-6-phosphate isomerase
MRSLPENIREALGMAVAKQEPANTICLYNFEESNVASDSISSFVFERTSIQIHTIVDRIVPAWADGSVDVIIMSYSGDSQEIDEVFSSARSRGCRIHCITSGGHLADLCRENGNHLLLVPGGLSNNDATGYEMGILINLYDAMGVQGIRDHMEKVLPRIVAYRDSVWDSEDVKKLAIQVKGKIPVIYCTGELRAVHKRWKMLINDEICRLAFSGEFPEFNHNELVSWTD